MCGIVGIYGEQALREYQKNLLYAWDRLKHRGEDSYGVIIQKTNGEVVAYKSLSKEALLSKLAEEEGKEFTVESLKWVLAHNRKASVGGITLELAHPVYNKDEKTLVIHNGTKKPLAGAFGTDSDTQALSIIFSIGKVEPKVRLLDGTGVVFCVRKTSKDRFKLYFHKDEERPLVLNKELGIFASEPFLEGEWYQVKEIPFKELKDLSEIVNLIDDKVSESVVIRKCSLCGREFVGSPKETHCKDCSEIYYDRYGRAYSSYKITDTTKKK